jgi:hypothetical protein
VLHHIAAQVVADTVRVPPGGGQQPLHPIRGALPSVLGQLPAILAAHVANQPTQLRQYPPAGLGAGEPTADLGVQRLQPHRPRLYLLDLCCRPIGVRHGPRPPWRSALPAPSRPAGGNPTPSSQVRLEY